MSTLHSLMFCTCPDRDSARQLADALVGEGLAACVNLVPGLTSIYRWEGRLQQDDEILLLIKTVAQRIPAVIDRLRRLHPYELPEIIAVPIVAGLPDYLSWIAACTEQPD